jgi:WD40 repeat protein
LATATGYGGAAGSKDFRIWDAETGELTRTCDADQLVYDLGWSPDGALLAAGTLGGRVWLYESASGDLVRTFAARNMVRDVHWLPDGKTLLSTDNLCNTRFWNTETGELRGTVIGVDMPAFSLSLDGHYRGPSELAENLVYVVQTEKGQETLTSEEFTAQYGWINDPERARLMND